MIGRAVRTLRVQLVLLIIVTLSVAQFISLFLFADERSLAIRAALGFEAAGRAANVARLIEEAPPELHESILRAANSPLVRFDLSQTPGVQHTNHSDGGLVEGRIRALLGDSFSRDIRVELHEVEGQSIPMPNMPRYMPQMHMAMTGATMTAVEMNLAIAISGGLWLNVGTRFERPPIQWPVELMATFAVSATVLLVAVIWFVMTRLTGPLRRLAQAADRLGRGEDVDPLPMHGPTEVRDMSRAFNRMQDRLTRYVDERTRMLAALGHDLRSPLTAMRVRAELVDDEETRDSLVASVEEMQGMVNATLTFAHGLTGAEQVETVDTGALLGALRTDMPEGFALAPGTALEVRLRPNAIRRALRNLIENANRYGGGAHVSWHQHNGDLIIDIEDRGAGIPPDMLEKVFAPFVRLEESRSLETGGHGLGLSIAKTIVQAHGGDITLSNRLGGGLRARVTLPLAGSAPRPGTASITPDGMTALA